MEPGHPILCVPQELMERAIPQTKAMSARVLMKVGRLDIFKKKFFSV